MAARPEPLKFEAETKALLHLMIHSLYTDRELFLRELISNASDALDRLRFESLTTNDLLEGDARFEIRLEVDRAARTLTISDSGIGMSRDEVIANIGTIAKSGTAEFQQLLNEKDAAAHAAELIGRFGVGFYSAFMVADRVTLSHPPGRRIRSRRMGIHRRGDLLPSGMRQSRPRDIHHPISQDPGRPQRNPGLHRSLAALRNREEALRFHYLLNHLQAGASGLERLQRDCH